MRILIISSQEFFRQAVQAACLRYDQNLVSIRTSDSIGQGLELAHQFEAQVIFIDLTKNVEAGLLAITQLAQFKNRLIITSADKLGADLMTRAIRAGSQELMPQPVQDEEVHDILQKAEKLISEDSTALQPKRNGKVILCFSSKGGVGKTTISSNLAVMLSQRFGSGSTCLIDANTQAPNIAPMLDLRPQHWLRDAVEEYVRLDSEMLKDLMAVHEASGTYVLAHSTDNPLGLDFSEDQLTKILLVAKGTFEYTIVDTFPLLSSLNLSMMDLADKVYLISESVVPSIRSARHNLEMLSQAGYSKSRIEVVLNRFTDFKGNVNPKLVEETINWPISHVLPYDRNATIAANNGQAGVLMFPESDLTLKLSEMVDSITGVPVEIKPLTGFQRVLNKLSNLLE
ncbi:MAG: AAA family ATPase [Methylotenera sp.]|nr:AAA family ATPase [Methylotenera sp.]